MLIGDWVKADHISVYMEKTNVSAKMAVNKIMEKIGDKKHIARVLPSGSPAIYLDFARLITSPRP